jgi:hypothetical protein
MFTECRNTIINIIPFSFIVALGYVMFVESVECREKTQLQALSISPRVRFKYIIDRINKSCYIEGQRTLSCRCSVVMCSNFVCASNSFE